MRLHQAVKSSQHIICDDTSLFVVVFKNAIYLNSLLSNGRVGVCEAMDDMRENLGVDCCLIQILNELLHLRRREENKVSANPFSNYVSFVALEYHFFSCWIVYGKVK